MLALAALAVLVCTAEPVADRFVSFVDWWRAVARERRNSVVERRFVFRLVRYESSWPVSRRASTRFRTGGAQPNQRRRVRDNRIELLGFRTILSQMEPR